MALGVINKILNRKNTQHMTKDIQILNALKNEDVPCQMASFQIAPVLLDAQNGDWNYHVNEFQCVGIFDKNVYSQDQKGASVLIGTLSADLEVKYDTGIICPFSCEPGTQRLDGLQKIILFKDRLPPAVEESFDIVSQAKPSTTVERKRFGLKWLFGG